MVKLAVDQTSLTTAADDDKWNDIETAEASVRAVVIKTATESEGHNSDILVDTSSRPTLSDDHST